MNLLILAGTSEASALAKHVGDAGIKACLSYAGRVERTKPQPIPKRIGGFGGVAGLCEYLEEEAVTHVIDATHPFAVQMSRNAVDACATLGLPLLGVERRPWLPKRGDFWVEVDSIAGAVDKLQRPKQRIMLALGRMHINAFAAHPHHHYLLRLVDPPASDITLPDYHSIVSRGPFTVEDDIALLRNHAIEMLVSKNSGGSGAISKIEAARALSLPVIMINRPPLLRERQEVESVKEAMEWLLHGTKDRGV